MEKLLKFDDEMRLKYAATLSKNGNANSRFEKGLKGSQVAFLLDLRNEIHEFKQNTENTLELFRKLPFDGYPDFSESITALQRMEEKVNTLSSIIDDCQYSFIVKQPVNVVCAIGDPVEFTVEATGYGLTYQWLVSTVTDSWDNFGIEGSKTPRIHFNVYAFQNGFKFRCKITNIFGNEILSDIATITII